MDALEAHARFGRMPDRSILPGTFRHMGCDVWPSAATAIAKLSGMLDDAETDDDLREAVEHGCSLISIGIITVEQVAAEAAGVVGELMEWGARVEAQAEAAPSWITDNERPLVPTDDGTGGVRCV